VVTGVALGSVVDPELFACSDPESALKGTVSPDIYGPVLVCLDISELGWEPLMIFRSVWTSSELILIFNSLMRLMRKLLRLIMLLGVLLQITANPTWSGILQFHFPIGA
jgi:hypothetical protein